MIELLAPAGNLEKLKIAIMYGADAVYIGGKQFSLRARASNFGINDIKDGCDFAKLYNKKVYVTMNIVPHNDDFDGLVAYLKGLVEAGVTGIIITSLYYAKVAKVHAPSLELHLSTQFSASNSETLEMFKSFGFIRAVLAREVGIDQIAMIRKKTDIDLEVFIHGGMCSSYSGRCMLSNHMTNRDANRGGCAHSCRWNYSLFKDNKQINKEDEFFNMGSKDLVAIRSIPKLIDLGVKSLKIEGRMKSIYYIATVVRCYRMLIDKYESTGKIKDFSFYEKEIAKAENRNTATGFLESDPGINGQLYNVRSEKQTKEFIGFVLGYDKEKGLAKIEQRNYFEVNNTLEFFGPTLTNTEMILHEMYDDNMEVLEVARHPLQIVYLKVPFNLEYGDMIRLANNRRDFK
jgi:putative protease